MKKRLICLISALILLLSAAVPVSVLSASQADVPIPASGENLLYGFDSINNLSEQPWKARWDNGGTAISLSLETSSENVYGGAGKSLKAVYDCSKKESLGPPAFWLSDKTITPKGKGITFWIKSSKDTKIRIVAADKSWKLLTVNSVEVKKGENLYYFKYSDFNNYSSADISRINQFQIRMDGNDAGTIWFDNFGFFDLPESGEDDDKGEEEQPSAVKIPGQSQVLWNFDSYNSPEEMNAAFKAHNAGSSGEGIQLYLESDKENVYGGNGKSLKAIYDRKKGTNTLPCIIHSEKLITKNEGFVFWLKSAEDTLIYLVAADKNGKTVKTANITVKQGENIIISKYSDFVLSSGGGTPDMSSISQLQIRPIGNNSTGTFWLDNFGFYSTPAVHQDDFFEYAVDAAKWKKNASSQADFKWEDNAEQYHIGITDVKDNTSALKIALKNLSNSNTNSVYYDSPIRISEVEPYIYGENSVLSFWIYSEQELRLDIVYMDKDANNNNVMSKTESITVKAGESIVKIPMSDMVKAGTSPAFKQVYQLQFRFFSTAGTANTSKSNVWIDAIGFYNKIPNKNTEPQYHDSKAFTWWNFDNYNTVGESPWKARWTGENGKGVSISLDDNPENTYGGSGKSLKVVYKAAESDIGQPCIWLADNRIAMYGKGFTFWVKSQYETKIRLVCIDADGKTASTDKIPLKIGENIVTVPYEGFVVSGENKPANMASASQLQIRAGISDSNILWVDEIGFYDIQNDGSNAYYSLNPPEEYSDWYEGISVVGDNFDAWPGDDDMKFCSEWYFDNTGWISLVNDAGNVRLKMDYDFTNSASSVLTNITEYKNVDPYGGISFYAKSSVERYYTLKVWLGNNTTAVIVFKAGTQGKYYKIPFSAFWLNNKINISYTPAGKGTVNVPKITVISDSTCNPPAVDKDKKFSLWLDDIKFVDSADYRRAGAVDYYENGVRLKADEDAFTVGVYPKVGIETLTETDKTAYLSEMNGSKSIIASYQINAFDMNNISAIPQKAVELTFDLPAGVDPNKAVIYQRFMDGSFTKRTLTVTEDGKVKAVVYRLGNYVLTVTDNSVIPSGTVIGGAPSTGDSFNLFGICGTAFLSAVVIFAGAAILRYMRKEQNI